jgi:hypothetical protein
VLHFWRHKTGPPEAMLVTSMTIARNLAVARTACVRPEAPLGGASSS